MGVGVLGGGRRGEGSSPMIGSQGSLISNPPDPLSRRHNLPCKKHNKLLRISHMCGDSIAFSNH